MTETVPPDHESDNGNVVRLPLDPEHLDPTDLTPVELTGHFLTESRHPSIRSGEPLAEFVLSYLSSTPDDEWKEALQTLKIDVDDSQFAALMEHDGIFISMLDLTGHASLRAERGQRAMPQKRALMVLMELRAGEYFRSLGRPDGTNDDGWRQMLHKLAPGATE